MIQSISSFIDCFESIRRRTLNDIRTVAPDRIDWSPRDGEFTGGDLARRLAAGEAMFVGAAVRGQWDYPDRERARHRMTCRSR